MPKRIQRRREKGWRMPDGVKSVTRPSKWGNPFVVSKDNGWWTVNIDGNFDDSRDWNAHTDWIWENSGQLPFEERKSAIDFALTMFKAWAILAVEHGDVDLSDICGRDLACWCAEGEPCHADIWLDLANANTRTEVTLDEYQEKAHQTSQNTLIGDDPYLYPIMGLAGEAAELLNKAKKVHRDHDGQWSDFERMRIVAELGDCLWYVAEVAMQLGVSLSGVAEMNIEKLTSRQERGKISGDGDNR